MTDLRDAGNPEGRLPTDPGPHVIRVSRPSDGSLVGELAVTPIHEIPGRVGQARTVQAGWASLEAGDRVRRLRGLLGAVDDRSREIEDTIIAETGKPRTEARVEILTVLEHLRFLLRETASFFQPKRVSTSWLLWKRGLILREPLGVVGIISPWNYPFILSMNPTLVSLFGGNGVVLKPSEYTPYCGLLVEDLARDAGLPEGLVQVVIGRGATGEALVRSGVDKVFFTGGPQTGRAVLAAAADSLTPVILELGGKDPAIVLEDADLERAARGVVWGALVNAGQTCISLERVYVVEEIFDAFQREVLKRVRELRAGSSSSVDLGPMTTPAQLELVEAHLEDAVSRGASVLTGGARTDPAANVLEATVLTDLEPGSRLLHEETFGPILPLIRVKDAEAAIQEANRGPYGLSASVWTRDRSRGLNVARRLKAGAVSVNDALAHYGVPSLPFGGSGESGFGTGTGLEGLGELTRSKSVLTDRLGMERELWWFPYSRATERLLRGMLHLRSRGWLRGLIPAARTVFRRPPK